GIDKSGEQQMLREMSAALAGLSRQQMTEVIRRLEDAARATDEKQSEQSVSAAYESHRRVLDALKDMLARFEAIKTLEQAADRFDKHAKRELELHLQTGVMIHDQEALSKPDL